MAALRIVLALHALAVAWQAVLAGRFLSGADAAVRWHEDTGWIVTAFCAAQIGVAAVRRIPRGSLLPFILSSVLILLAELLQVGTGYGRFPAVHVPLGVLIFGGVIAQALWVFR